MAQLYSSILRASPIVVVLVVGVLMEAAGCRDEQQPPAPRDKDWSAAFSKAVPALMAEFSVPGVALAVVDTSGLVEKGVQTFTRGQVAAANPISYKTVFEGASLGKPLFAYAFLHSHRLPPVDIDAPIEDYLGLSITADEAGRSITARQLLSHTSGLVYAPRENRRLVESPPGKKWKYSGLGYVILQQTAEKTWNASLEELVNVVLPDSLKMSRTSWLPPDTTADRTVGHTRAGAPLRSTPWTVPSASSTLHTTVVDYGRFVARMLADIAEGDSVSLRMIQPQVDVDSQLGLSWGLGWAVAEDAGDTLFLHWGSNPGYKSLAIGSTKQNLGLVVLTNGDNGLEVATRIVPLVFGKNYDFLQFYMLHPDD